MEMTILYILSNLYTHYEVWIYNPKIKSHMLDWLSQPGTTGLCFKNEFHIMENLLGVLRLETRRPTSWL